MSIASVLDPRCKFCMIGVCFPLLSKLEEIAKENVKLWSDLQQLYDEYVALSNEESSSNERNVGGINSSSVHLPYTSSMIGFDQLMSLMHEKEIVPPMKSELDAYLEKKNTYIPNNGNSSFSALEWWRNNNFKYKILSKMARDTLVVPVSIVASESTFRAGGRVIDEYRSRLNEESIEALICSGDWIRHNYNLKRKTKVHKFYF